MFSKLRGLVATLAVCAFLAVSAAPASAVELSSNSSADERSVNVLFDAFVLRPLGLVVTVSGAVAYGVIIAPLVAMTRPSDLGKPLEPLVLRPARYTFVDPLGEH
jgi:hypothetical protein